jgi:drug/metabolite transporter (DMT)-like permease
MANAEVLAGMAAAAAAAACFDGAVILQAQEAREVESGHALRLSLIRRLAKRPRWLLGTAIAVLGWPLQLLALSLAPLTVVQPMLAIGLVVLLIAGSRVLGEPVRPWQWVGAAAVIVGVTLLGVAAPEHTETVPAPAAMAAAALGLGAVMAAPFLFGRTRSGAWMLICAAGAAFALSALTSKLVTVELEDGRLLVALLWALATALCAGLGFLTDQTALQRFAATRVAPPMFALETALPVMLSPLLFDEHWGSTLGGGAVLAVGLALVLGGGGIVAAAAGEREHQLGGVGKVAVPEVGRTG